MFKKSFIKPILIGLITFIFASCDKDFNELGTDIVGNDNYGFEIDTLSTVKTFNQKLGPIASIDLPINPLGFYTNPVYGTTQANFVTQLELSSLNPIFNNSNAALYVNLPVIDSVVMDIPYFKTLKKSTEVTTDGIKYIVRDHVLDSIYGELPGTANSKFKLSVFQSNFFLRDLDPNQFLTEEQLFYTDDNNAVDNNKIPVLLNDLPIGLQNPEGRENSAFYFDKREHKLTTYREDGITPIYTRSAPSMRLHLRKDVFNDKILNAPSGILSNQALFKNYLRGLYFKAEDGNPGNMAMLNFKLGKISIYYKEDKITPDKPETTTVNEYKLERLSKIFGLNLIGNTVSLLQNFNENVNYLTAANSTQEASRLYLKGGEGSMAVVDLFGAVDIKGYILNPAFNNNVVVSISNPKYILVPGSNGVSDEIDDIKFNGWLINEANLIFYIDKIAMPDTDKKTIEPNRIFLYDLTNNKVLNDYIFDGTAVPGFPTRNKFIFGGILLNKDGAVVNQMKSDVGEITKKGTKYKFRITNYVRSLIKNDSTNVRFGLTVTESINNVGLSKLRIPNATFNRAPTMSVMNPLGIILYGSNIPVAPTQEYKKRLKLEIYYTKTKQ